MIQKDAVLNESRVIYLLFPGLNLQKFLNSFQEKFQNQANEFERVLNEKIYSIEELKNNISALKKASSHQESLFVSCGFEKDRIVEHNKINFDLMVI